jgi:thymidine kinase
MPKHLKFYYGPMGAGKTSKLLNTVDQLRELSFRYLVLKPSLDTRSKAVLSRSGRSTPAIPLEPEGAIADVIQTKLDFILIDEAQFLTLNQVEEARELTLTHSVGIIMFGLMTDYRGTLFPGSQRLVEVADEICQIQGTCTECHIQLAIINSKFRMEGERKVTISSGSEVIDVGGEDKYRSLCWGCWKIAKEQP